MTWAIGILGWVRIPLKSNLDERIDLEKKPSMDVVMKTPDGELRVVLELEHRLRILKRKNPVFILVFNCIITTLSKKP